MSPPFDRRRWLTWAASVSLSCAAGSGPAPLPAGVLRPGATRSVIVVGAGLAGLACAYRLLQRGHEVLLLEATRRPGGRICTVRDPWSEGLFVEAGASHLVSEPALLALLGELGVATEARERGPELAARAWLRAGQRHVLAPGEHPPPEHELSAAEQALGEDALMQHYFAPAHAYDAATPLTPELLTLDDLSGADYLRRQGASPGFLREVDGMLGVGDRGLDGMSALFLVRTWAQISREMAWGPSRRISGGFEQLPRALAQRLGERLVYGAPVVAVVQTHSSVEVTFEQRGSRATRSAERVVFAVPAPILRALPVSPVLSAEKQRALAELGLESVTRVWLQADRRFWTERGESGRVDTDLPIGPIREETEGQPGRSGLLGIYATRGESRRLAQLSDAQRISEIALLVERAHPGLREHFVVGASKCWDNEPFQRGAYAYFQPGQLRTLGPELARAEGRCHFCGDHTSERPGFMHGALASAWRVVGEIAQAGA